jgi:hypothetical protein
MIQSYFLSSGMLRTSSPHNGTRAKHISVIAGQAHIMELDALFHLLRDFLVNGITKVFNRAFATAENNRCAVIGCEAAWLCVHAYKIERLPHRVNKLVNVHPFLGRNGYAHRDLVE